MNLNIKNEKYFFLELTEKVLTIKSQIEVLTRHKNKQINLLQKQLHEKTIELEELNEVYFFSFFVLYYYIGIFNKRRTISKYIIFFRTTTK